MDEIKRLHNVGAPVRRLEDRALVTGAGRFLDDIAPERSLFAVLVRSTAAHARFVIRDLAAVRGNPGVRLVLTAADIADLGTMPIRNAGTQPDGSRPAPPPHPVLARTIVRHVGEPVAFIVADDLDAAKDAAERVEIDYDLLPAVVDGRAALADGAPLLHAECGANLAYDYHLGDRREADAVFARAARVTRIHLVNNRVSAAFLETRGVIAEYDVASGRYTLTLGCQGGHVIRRMLAAILRIDESRLRIVTPDVGGAFGAKIFTYPEYALAALAAAALGRPVKWIGERIEHFLADTHGRDQDSIAEMAMDENGRFLALRVDTVANIGAYCSENAAWGPYAGSRMVTGCYDIPVLFARVRGAYTNTMLVDAYRGAGRPEAAYLIERLVDACARDAGLGPVDIRRMNLIKPDQMPYRTASGVVYDTGAFERHLLRALDAADFAGFEQRAERAAEAGLLPGFGIAVHIDACSPPGAEPATLTLDADGAVTLLIGTQTGGQGHATAYAQFIVAALGIGYDQVRVVQGDTDRIPKGGGTGGSRSIPLGAPSVQLAARSLARKIREVASGLLEAAPADLELGGGRVRVAGTDRAISLAEVAAAAPSPAALSVVEAVEITDRTYPNGTHAAEVEIDPETGLVRIVRYVVVDDFGAVVNPLLLEGQVHGGVVQGIGQALFEHVRYDSEGQLLTASFQDYCIARADDLANILFETRNVPATSNPLGIKGAGEAGVMGSCPAVMNAVADALKRAGITEWLDMPATPERVWSLLRRRRRSP